MFPHLLGPRAWTVFWISNISSVPVNLNMNRWWRKCQWRSRGPVSVSHQVLINCHVLFPVVILMYIFHFLMTLAFYADVLNINAVGLSWRIVVHVEGYACGISKTHLLFVSYKCQVPEKKCCRQVTLGHWQVNSMRTKCDRKSSSSFFFLEGGWGYSFNDIPEKNCEKFKCATIGSTWLQPSVS